jgi:uncharacterized protein YjiK
MMNENEQHLNLTYLDRIKIKDKKEGLKEPSGLAISYKNGTLWTVSDDTKRVYNLNLDGEIIKGTSFKLDDKDLEGIALDPSAEFLFTVREKENEIIKYEVDGPHEVGRAKLADIEGFADIDHHFSGGVDTKGLEGITWNSTTETIFVMKESNPGLLVQVSAELDLVFDYHVLNHENGFSSKNGDEVDFSGICYDESRDCFWIVSDKAKRLFLYDWHQNEVIQSALLSYRKKGKSKKIKKAEGIAVDPDNNRLYIVSDKDARLYIFDIRE